MSRFDSLLRKNYQDKENIQPLKKSRPVVFPLYYFYRSLRVVLMMWIVMLIVVITAPWADYYVKKTIDSRLQQILGATDIAKIVSSPVVIPTTAPTITSAAPTFNLKKGDLEIKAPIVEGITDEDLIKGIGHHPDSVWPNEKGNVVVAGHSFSLDAENEFGQVFGELRQVEIGDQVTVKYDGKFYIYKVFKKETVGPSDLSLMGKSDDWILTFYTCDPPKTDWRRLVFQAELIKLE